MDLQKHLQKRRSLVESQGTCFESTPLQRVADVGAAADQQAKRPADSPSVATKLFPGIPALPLPAADATALVTPRQQTAMVTPRQHEPQFTPRQHTPLEGTPSDSPSRRWSGARHTPLTSPQTGRTSCASGTAPPSLARARRMSGLNDSASEADKDLLKKLNKRRSVVDSEGACFESSPTVRIADEGPEDASEIEERRKSFGARRLSVASASSPNRENLTRAMLGLSPCCDDPEPDKRDFEQVISFRKGLSDKHADTFKSEDVPLFSEKGLPPSPTRARRNSLMQPSTLPAAPPPPPASWTGGLPQPPSLPYSPGVTALRLPEEGFLTPATVTEPSFDQDAYSAAMRDWGAHCATMRDLGGTMASKDTRCDSPVAETLPASPVAETLCGSPVKLTQRGAVAGKKVRGKKLGPSEQLKAEIATAPTVIASRRPEAGVSVENSQVVFWAMPEKTGVTRIVSSAFEFNAHYKAQLQLCRQKPKGKSKRNKGASSDRWTLSLRGWQDLSVRGWQQSESRVLVALFVGTDGKGPREWKGPVLEEDFSFKWSGECPLVCGFLHKMLKN